MPQLPASFFDAPIAHRALHDLSENRPENSRAAIRAAVAAGYGIEIDLQLSKDGQAMVFHDYHLGRLTNQTGPVRQRSAQDLGQISLSHGDGEGIPTFCEILEIVAGQVPLLVELKDQDGALGPDVGPLEQAVAQDLNSYSGPVALMSFNPHSVASLADLAPHLPRGLTTETFSREDWPTVPAARCKDLTPIPDFDRVGASFVSHNHRHLSSAAIAGLTARDVPILCWTIRSADEEAQARKIAANITFEGYLA